MQLQEGFRHGICGEECEIESKRLHNLPVLHNHILAGDLELMVVLPCDLCPHHYQRDHRWVWEAYGYGRGNYERFEESVTDEELEVAAQLMELSSQSLHLTEEGLESSSISDSRRSYGVAPSGRKVVNVDAEERLKPRSRSVNEMFKQPITSRKRRRGLTIRPSPTN
ncbi:hypothetical protein KI387_026388 [Taxus chinensis]|uniref:Uncharacterized protein n=1 Tax=Taxus chinensis TaxID=29808 RepID=A0AA38FY67_TAXCH|nr:hypothetical protein KI387_026388 [Taxus chinensis]